jgi:hydrogenase maturation factor HypF (carbamoyltransferase family)
VQSAAEHHDPANRRFHAQLVCCPACGPRLALLTADGAPIPGADPLVATTELLRFGQIVAVKGLDALIVRGADLVASVAADLVAGVAPSLIAARFHNGVAQSVVEVCKALREQTGLTTVALSGGVFQNELLVGGLVTGLGDCGFRVVLHSRVPCNDGGISLGRRRWPARATARRGLTPWRVHLGRFAVGPRAKVQDRWRYRAPGSKNRLSRPVMISDILGARSVWPLA